MMTTGTPAKTRGSGLLHSWVIVVLALLGIWAVFFGIPALIRTLNAPPISDDFGLEDAVVALRLYADDVSYLVLVDEAGEARSVQLEERGFENARLVWSDAGLSTGGPSDEYVLHDDGLGRVAIPGALESPSEATRLALGDGFVVYDGSAHGQRITFVDAAGKRIRTREVGYAHPALATCGDELVLVDDSGVRTVTPETEGFDGLGLFDDVTELVCDGERVYGLGQIIDEEESAHQRLQVWDRRTGVRSEAEIRYPKALLSWRPGTPFVREGRLHWAAGSFLWSLSVAGESPSGAVDAEQSADLGGFLDHLSPVVGTDSGLLAHGSGRVFGVAEESEFIDPSKGPSYDELERLAIFSADAVTGERRIEITVDGIDFPKRDLHVTAIAVDPEWAARR